MNLIEVPSHGRDNAAIKVVFAVLLNCVLTQFVTPKRNEYECLQHQKYLHVYVQLSPSNIFSFIKRRKTPHHLLCRW